MPLERRPESVQALKLRYPRTAGCFTQTYDDLRFAQRWEELEVVDLPTSSRGAIIGRKPATEKKACVVPCWMSESLSMSWISSVFKDLNNPDEIYLAINTEDSSLVYYKLSEGIVKPPL